MPAGFVYKGTSFLNLISPFRHSCKTVSRRFMTLKTHTKCINNVYPSSNVQRINVPNDKISWKVDFPSYFPPTYNSPVLEGKLWADIDIIQNPDEHIEWNKYDAACNVDRSSFHGDYLIVNSLPRNPVGRTGLMGRGLLGRWGPNHAADPIVTRWLKDEQGSVVTNENSGKRQLQFVAIQRRDTKEWAIPGGMTDPGEQISQTLKREFAEEALDEQDGSRKLDGMFQHGIEIYKGYVDDPRNTDNSWMETVACNFHDEEGTLFTFKCSAGSDAQHVEWMNIDRNISLYASHKDLIQQVAHLRNAHW